MSLIRKGESRVNVVCCWILVCHLCRFQCSFNAKIQEKMFFLCCNIYDHKNTSNNLIQLQYLTLGVSEENGTTSMVTEPSTVSPYNCCPIYLNPNIMVSTSTGDNRCRSRLNIAGGICNLNENKTTYSSSMVPLRTLFCTIMT